MLSTRALVERTRSQQGRHCDLRVRWIAQRPDGEHDPQGEVILDVGGRWDSLTKRWDGAGASLDIGLHTGQLESARWIARWMAAKARGENLHDRGAPVYSLLLEGGRRGGKTDIGTKAAIAYPVMRPRIYSWMISETEKKTQEYAEVVRDLLPSGWYDWLGAPHYTFTLRNGSVIWLRSAHEPQKLKTGRCDFAAFNEMQLISKEAYTVVRGATADNGGLTIMMANPPDKPIGFWLEKWRDNMIAGKNQGKSFFLDAKRNPHVDHGSLEAMRNEVDERTFRREVLGEWLPRVDVVFHAWSDGPHGNVAPLPELGKDVTHEFLTKKLRREFDACLGIDLQKNPYPCAVSLRAYEDPEDPTGDPLIWFDAEMVAEGGDEAALSELMVEWARTNGYDPKRVALIVDASGAWQRIERKEKRIPSFDLFRALGWPWCYKPDDDAEKNPPIIERVKCANALFRTAHGKRRVFSAPENALLNEAIKMWENRSGAPYRKSEFAHLCDAATYPLFRFFPRKRVARPAGAAPRAASFPSLRPGGPRRGR